MQNDDENTKKQQLNEVVRIEENSLPIYLIEQIATNPELFSHYKNKHENLYSVILRSLTHEIYEESEAKSLWCEILKHNTDLSVRLGRNVGVAVATLDFLLNIKGKLSEPKIIEEEKSELITRISTKDELTGLYTREVFEVTLSKELAKCQRTSRSVCLLMIDIDDFKSINDNFGHPCGDKVLNQVGDIINHEIREMDLAARFGGEEFVIVMPNTAIMQAKKIAERIRLAIQDYNFADFEVTISVGVSKNNKNEFNTAPLIKRADYAMYQAKQHGKNQVVLDFD